jgi:serine/threonine-protein kinase HipA
MEKLNIYFERWTVGSIDVEAVGPGFTYEPDWINTRGSFPISTQIPLKLERTGPDIFLPWAANLLPESTQLQAVGQYLGVALTDVIGILSEIGRDTAGALSIGRPGSTSPVNWRTIKNDADLERIIDELPKKPFLVGEEGVSMSLAGVQSKLAVAVDAYHHICIPTEGSPSTHILKPDAERLWGGVQNEAFCLTLARRVKIQTPEITTGKVGKRIYLLVKRYDRTQIKSQWRRLHQEDFCQALGKPPSAKYESNQTGIHGPTLQNMFEIVRNFMSPTEILKFLDMVIFNVIACNTDAHAKNYSIMISSRGQTLAPLYDVMCGEVWENVTKNLAQKIGGKNRGDHIWGHHWLRFARDCGLGGRQVLARVERLAREVVEQAKDAAAEVATMPAGGHPILDQTRAAVERRAHTLLTQLRETKVNSDDDDETEAPVVEKTAEV